jgi:subtilisin-like proprotein convertase family protein
MKALLQAGVLAMSLAAAHAAVYEYNYDGASQVNLAIPDGNPGGVVSKLTINDEIGTIQDVNVYLNISGGYNGDIYGYLVAPNNSYAILLNRIGRDTGTPFGNTGSGIVVNLDDGVDPTVDNIHSAAFGTVTGTYAPDGRTANPASVVFGDSVTQTLSDINGSASGTWTLFLADLAGGDRSTLVSWGLQIESVVPEPTTWAVIIFGSVFVAGHMTNRLRHTRINLNQQRN